MLNRYLIVAVITSVALVSCSNEEYIGEDITLINSLSQISFNSVTPQMTRSDATTAERLGNNFVVFGTKTVNNNIQKVFDNYQVNYVTNTAHTTESNSANWEYVNYTNVPDGVTTNVGVTAFSALTGSNEANSNGVRQSIKFWDFNASQYSFFAYSLGIGTGGESPTYATATAMVNDGTNCSYSLSGTQDQLSACYISKKNTISSLSSSSTQVNLEFVNFMSKIQLKFYETIPGYSVKELRFYADDVNTTSTTTPYLYAGSSAIVTGGTYHVGFDSNGTPLISLETQGQTTTTNIAFSTTLTDYAGADHKEVAGNYLGRTSNAATSTASLGVFPNDAGVALTLKMDYTLVSRDGTNEIIHVKGATAIIPATFTVWQPNYAYTYIFKITDNDLYPITLDAVIIMEQTGYQETITTVHEPSITTYCKGQVVTENAEYPTGKNIYVVVNNGTENVALTTANAKLYRVTLTNTKTSDQEGYYASPLQEITEATVENALATGVKDNEVSPTTWTTTDYHNWALVVTTTDVPTLTSVTEIDANDAPDGNAITINGAKFKPTTPGTYVFEYTIPAVYLEGVLTSPETKHYKVIKVVE